MIYFKIHAENLLEIYLMIAFIEVTDGVSSIVTL
jgi:hypothetical protein